MAVETTTFEALGRTWRFKFGWAAICRLEEEHNRPLGEIFAEMLPGLTPAALDDPEELLRAVAQLRYAHLSSLIAAGLEGDHTREAVADIMDDLGLERALTVIFKAQKNDLPPAGDKPPKKGPARARGRNGSTATR